MKYTKEIRKLNKANEKLYEGKSNTLIYLGIIFGTIIILIILKVI